MKKKTVRVTCHNARLYVPGEDRVPWLDVYFEYYIGRRVRRLAPCIVGRAELEGTRILIEHAKANGDEHLWSWEIGFVAAAKETFAGGERIYVDRDDRTRIPNVAVDVDYVDRFWVEQVARVLLGREGISSELSFRYKKIGHLIAHPISFGEGAHDENEAARTTEALSQ